MNRHDHDHCGRRRRRLVAAPGHDDHLRDVLLDVLAQKTPARQRVIPLDSDVLVHGKPERRRRGPKYLPAQRAGARGGTKARVSAAPSEYGDRPGGPRGARAHMRSMNGGGEHGGNFAAARASLTRTRMGRASWLAEGRAASLPADDQNRSCLRQPRDTNFTLFCVNGIFDVDVTFEGVINDSRFQLTPNFG